MDILIIDQELNPAGTSHVTAQAGRVKAYVGRYKSNWITVTAMNAMHRVYRGAGRTFATWDEALAGYKSAEMKAIIHTARDILTPEPAIK
jgi:hypothetical protein